MTIKKEFTPDMAALGKEFDLEKNRVKREAYKANHTREQKQEVLAKWKEFMKETSSNHFHVSRWPQSALSFVYFCIVCNLPPFWYQSQPRLSWVMVGTLTSHTGIKEGSPPTGHVFPLRSRFTC